MMNGSYLDNMVFHSNFYNYESEFRNTYKPTDGTNGSSYTPHHKNYMIYTSSSLLFRLFIRAEAQYGVCDYSPSLKAGVNGEEKISCIN